MVLFVASTESRATQETAIGLATASLDRGHDVSVFFSERSVRLLKVGINDEFKVLVERGARLLACRTSAMGLGLKSLEDLVEGAEMSSLGELVDLMGDSDRVLFVG